MTKFPNYGRAGSGLWTANNIRRRYEAYARRLRVAEPRQLCHLGEFPDHPHPFSFANIMDEVIQGIRDGDLACAQIGVAFIEQDAGFTFGAILKSNTATALRQAPVLTDEQVGRIQRRVVHLITKQEMPREWKAYSKLLAKVGFAHFRHEIEGAFPKNWNAKRSRDYLLRKIYSHACMPKRRSLGNLRK